MSGESAKGGDYEDDFVPATYSKTLYTVRTTEQTITNGVTTKSYKDTEHVNFFNSLNGTGGTVSEGNWYQIKQTMNDFFPAKLSEVNNIFKTLVKASGGSRRRRPSRKYKKSKRVLRRKSRSTRRR
jgi:hypothetical protein